MQLSEAELARYQFMAEAAARMEQDLWAAAGVVEGAVVADVERWSAAFDRMDVAEERPTLFAPFFFAFGRRPLS